MRTLYFVPVGTTNEDIRELFKRQEIGRAQNAGGKLPLLMHVDERYSKSLFLHALSIDFLECVNDLEASDHLVFWKSSQLSYPFSKLRPALQVLCEKEVTLAILSTNFRFTFEKSAVSVLDFYEFLEKEKFREAGARGGKMTRKISDEVIKGLRSDRSEGLSFPELKKKYKISLERTQYYTRDIKMGKSPLEKARAKKIDPKNVRELKRDLKLTHVPAQTPVRKLVEVFLVMINSRTTFLNYMHDIELFFLFAKNEGVIIEKISDVTEETCSHFQDSQFEDGMSKATVLRRLTTLSSLMRFAMRRGELQKNPLSGIKKPNVESRNVKTNGFTERELEQIFSLLKADIKKYDEKKDSARYRIARYRFAMFYTLISTGMRESEIRNLKMEDFKKFGERWILEFETKGGRDHKVPLTGDAGHVLMEYVMEFRSNSSQTSPLFPTPGEEFIPSASLLFRMIRQLAKRVGITKTVSAHSCRVTAATRMHYAGMRLDSIKRILNHCSVKTTERYIQLSENDYIELELPSLVGIGDKNNAKSA